MPTDPFASLRLALMQDVLPVGMAVVERVRRGGPREVVEAFTAAADPLAQLRQEGDSAARAVRDSLDQIQPGLGNPVVRVDVRDIPPEAVVTTAAPGASAADRQALHRRLARISEHLGLLEQRLEA